MTVQYKITTTNDSLLLFQFELTFEVEKWKFPSTLKMYLKQLFRLLVDYVIRFWTLKMCRVDDCRFGNSSYTLCYIISWRIGPEPTKLHFNILRSTFALLGFDSSLQKQARQMFLNFQVLTEFHKVKCHLHFKLKCYKTTKWDSIENTEARNIV